MESKMSTTTRPVTADELLRMPDDGHRYELIRGEIVRMSPAGQQHGHIAATLLLSLGQHVRSHRLGRTYAAETGFKLASNPDHVRAPDAAFIAQERIGKAGDIEGFWPGAPDLAIEVTSPNDTYAEVEDKVFDWLEAGCRMVVVVNPRKRAVTVYRSLSEVKVLGPDDVLDGEDVVRGWRLPVAEIFA
jgi:Uma2 family endonuclease